MKYSTKQGAIRADFIRQIVEPIKEKQMIAKELDLYRKQQNPLRVPPLYN